MGCAGLVDLLVVSWLPVWWLFVFDSCLGCYVFGLWVVLFNCLVW